LSRQIFKDNLSENEKENNLLEKENRGEEENTLKMSKAVPSMRNSGTPIV
jgi:hypothetical protein